MHHGTLLFSSDIVNLSGALKPKKIKFQDKAVKSVVSRITNISEHLNSEIDVLTFKNKIFDYILKSEKDAKVMPLTQDEIDEIEKIKKINMKLGLGTLEVLLSMISTMKENLQVEP